MLEDREPLAVNGVIRIPSHATEVAEAEEEVCTLILARIFACVHRTTSVHTNLSAFLPKNHC